MFYGAGSGRLKFGNTDMDYITFGQGRKPLVLIPGVGDGMKNVRGMAVPFAIMYRSFVKKYKVYVFSRKNVLKKGCTTYDMSEDVKTAMKMLSIEKADIIGISQGGMVAQHFAADYPQMVGKLVLVVTSAEPNAYLTKAATDWIKMAEQKAGSRIMQDMIIRMYTKTYREKHKWMLFCSKFFWGPKSYERFMRMAEACITHDACDKLGQIRMPVLIIGGGKDKTVGAEASGKLAEKIAGSELFIYPECGHGVYAEAADFNERVLAFLEEDGN